MTHCSERTIILEEVCHLLIQRVFGVKNCLLKFQNEDKVFFDEEAETFTKSEAYRYRRGRSRLVEISLTAFFDSKFFSDWVITEANNMGGPLIREDGVRGFGLFAERDYSAGEKVTTYVKKFEKTFSLRCNGRYGGVLHRKEIQGDYVALLGDGIHIDGRTGFRFEEKGRWINESDRDRSGVNVKLGRDVKTVCAVKKGEQFFADYGGDYQRDY